ncbi:hypothetical protein E1292_23090 [Nonomuraea deserti]|uniref:Uncharacterized protein n=1 Tax=Nonomuraea deserti TaxID=1848322 RepID=A0A4R4VIH2_9ACTN|nr:hypothetical protein E1292_23090 [Nonomuraea deserti]
MTVKALIRFLLGDPAGHSADGRMIGLGLSTALRKHYSADDAERYLRQWTAEQDVRKSPRC